MGNRPVSEIYEPGSTGKVLTMSAVLEEGKAKPRSKMVVPPVLTRGGHTTHDHEDHGTLHLTLNGVLAQSSNIGTILFADRIGGRQLYEYQRKFGMGQRTGLNFPGEENGHPAQAGELVADHVPGAGVRPELLAHLAAGRQRVPDASPTAASG